MNFNPLTIIRTFIPDDVIRAKVLAEARHIAQWAAGFVFAWALAFLTSKGVDTANATLYATAIASAVGALIVAVLMGIFALLDVNKVAKKIDAVATVAAAPAPDPVAAKAQALAALKAGKA